MSNILNSEKQQLNVIRDQAIRRLSIVDLNLNGNEVVSDEAFVKIGFSATKNKILFWLNSILGDVVRSTQGSPLIGLLGQKITEDNKSEYEFAIQTDFEETFTTGAVELTSISIETENISKITYISLEVTDKITDSLIPINLEVVQ